MKPNQIEPPKKIFFFEREDGSIFHVGEREAWAVYKGHNQTVGISRPRLKLVGVSNGMKFHEAVIEAHELNRTNPQAALERIKKGENDEWEAAKGHIEIPRDFDTVDERGRPVRIQDLR